jgi:PhnB protein
MKGTNVYLTFDGNCRQAMQFYAKCLKAELQVMSFGDMAGSQGPQHLPPGAENRVMHSRLSNTPALIMGSDTMPGMPFQQGNNFSINIDCESVHEAEWLFKAFSENGKITMPIAETFWAERFGMLVDQFGIPWMFNFEKPNLKMPHTESGAKEPVHA